VLVGASALWEGAELVTMLIHPKPRQAAVPVAVSEREKTWQSFDEGGALTRDVKF